MINQAQTAYQERTEHEASALATRYQVAQQAVAALSWIDKPECGKPGRGYKAARRQTSALRAAQSVLETIDQEIASWYTQNRKASQPTRARRLAVLHQFLPDWQP